MKVLISDLQVALFASVIDLSNKVELTSSIIKKSNGLFNGETVMIPVPNDAPSEIPRVILNNVDSSYALQVGLNRYDFYFHERSLENGLPTKTLEDLKEDFTNKYINVTKAIFETTGAIITRIGFVPNLTINSDNAAKNIRERYINKTKIPEDIREINLAINRRDKLEEFEVNTGIKIGAFRKVDDPLDNKLIIINFDINTLVENNLNLKVQDTVKYFELAYDYVTNNINKYV